MRTASAKKRGRGGQNRRQDAPRYEGGRINYNQMQREDAAVERARQHRMRLPGVTKQNATSEAAGTVYGRMYLMREISERQYRAAQEFDKRRSSYLAAISAPRRPRSGSDLGYLRERLSSENMPEADPVRVFQSEQDHEEWVASAKARYAEVRRPVLEADPFGMMAMEMIVVEDRMSERHVGAFRVACNRIADVLKIGESLDKRSASLT